MARQKTVKGKVGGVKAPSATGAPTGVEEAKASLENDYVKISGVEVGGDSEAMLFSLASQPGSGFFIPCVDSDKPGVSETTVQLNGLKVTIKKGVQNVQLPQQIIDVLVDSYNLTQAATVGNPKNLDKASADTKEVLGL